MDYRPVDGTTGFAGQGPAGDRTDLAGYSGTHLTRRGHLRSAARRRGQRGRFRAGPVAGERGVQQLTQAAGVGQGGVGRLRAGGCGGDPQPADRHLAPAGAPQ
jgi:hypothetical protein